MLELNVQQRASGGTAVAVGTAESIYGCRQMSKSIHETVPNWTDIGLGLLSCWVVGG